MIILDFKYQSSVIHFRNSKMKPLNWISSLLTTQVFHHFYWSQILTFHKNSFFQCEIFKNKIKNTLIALFNKQGYIILNILNCLHRGTEESLSLSKPTLILPISQVSVSKVKLESRLWWLAPRLRCSSTSKSERTGPPNEVKAVRPRR